MNMLFNACVDMLYVSKRFGCTALQPFRDSVTVIPMSLLTNGMLTWN